MAQRLTDPRAEITRVRRWSAGASAFGPSNPCEDGGSGRVAGCAVAGAATASSNCRVLESVTLMVRLVEVR